ncbi:MAG: LysR family transcriptional regulator [Saprospiraceae bacterium]|nr:LysR family transcriptional regulator [Saprospiraceae bacterium]MCB9310671.1 LysR family transcriptional regulator [Lewinellaceae bacterium]
MNFNISQLKYLMALGTSRSFSAAAEICNVSQPALSMAIKRLEDEFGIQMIDRGTSPLSYTETGEMIASQVKTILEEVQALELLISDLKNDDLSGEIKISVIPTLAPYLIPLFLKKFETKYPNITLVIEENTTASTVKKLKSSELDAGILVTPLDEKSIVTHPMFFEEFYVYSHSKIERSYVLQEELDLNNFWLLEEGHCMRQQMIRLCELRDTQKSQLKYNAGSIESIINLTDTIGGMTIIPEMATWRLPAERKSRVTPFVEPSPVREISLIHHKFTTKSGLLMALKGVIEEVIPGYMKIRENAQRIDISPPEPFNQN